MTYSGVYPQQLQHVRQVLGHVLRGVAAVRQGAREGHLSSFTSLQLDTPHNLAEKREYHFNEFIQCGF